VAVRVYVLYMRHETCVMWICTDVRLLQVPIAEHMCISMDLYDKLFTQFSSNLIKHNATGHLQHLVRHVLNVWSTDLHVGSHTVATAANPARMMNRALKEQATELGPNMWQQQQGIAKYDKKFHILVFLHQNNVQVRQQDCKHTTGMQAGLPIYR